MLERIAPGLVLASVVALAARRAGSLSASGALAATVVGGACVAAGWRWGGLLVLYFAVLATLSRAGAAEKTRRTGGMLEREGARDAAQVFANGGVFAADAFLTSLTGGAASEMLAMAALGALAASAADTSATEIGTLFGGTPRSVLTTQRVPAGTSGGVSGVGTAAMLGGALLIALAAAALSLTHAILTVTIAGASGALADSLLGATLQERRWCAVCERTTERRIHDCGTATVHAGGLAKVDNDVVNLLATLVGAAVAAALAIV